jgi:hypothetical protein
MKTMRTERSQLDNPMPNACVFETDTVGVSLLMQKRHLTPIPAAIACSVSRQAVPKPFQGGYLCETE